MAIGDHQLDPAQATPGSLRRNPVQKVSASEGPMSMPSTSRRPSLLTPTAMIGDRDDTAGLAHLYIGGVDPEIGPVALERSVEEGLTRSSISSHSRLTWLLEMPDMPMALTRSSTERVEMPWM